MKKLLITLAAIVSTIVSFAEQTQPIQKTFKQDPFNHPDFPAFVVTGNEFSKMLKIKSIQNLR
jgi:hypothetical protein